MATKTKSTKLSKVSSKPKPSTQEILCEALTQFYPFDKLSPGLTVAFLASGGDLPWYCSINRYTLATTGGINRTTSFKSRAKTLDGAVKQTADKWYKSIEAEVKAHTKALRGMNKHLRGA